MSPENVSPLRALLFWVGFFLLFCGEMLRPYRPPTVSRVQRFGVNISLGALNAAVLHLLFFTVTLAALHAVTENRLGVLNSFSLPNWGKGILTILCMDFVIYAWHRLNHTLPLLWRVHRVHHSDLNMDVSTALRFHLGEMLPFGFVKVGLIYFLGADLAGVFLFESLVAGGAQLQHSSLALPERFERVFWTLFVPPSMHRIHHSVKIAERNANYGAILSLWDRLLGTLRQDIDPRGIVIGMGAYRQPEELQLPRLLGMPFTSAVR